MIFLGTILTLVVYLTITGRDAPRERHEHLERREPEFEPAPA